MSEKVMSWLNYLAQYPPWVLVLAVLLIASAVLIFVIFSPSRASWSKPMETLKILAGVHYAVLRPFLQGNCTIVVGTYYDQSIQWWEATGLIGPGNALALGRILGVLKGLRAMECEVVPSAKFPGDRLQKNLILIGGPDANEVTRRVIEKLPTRLKFGDADHHEISIADSSTGKIYIPKRLPTGALADDFAVALKAPNPFHENTSVIVVAGSFGHGTHAAAWMLQMESLLSKIGGASEGHPFEALLHTEIVNGWPQSPKILQAYRL